MLRALMASVPDALLIVLAVLALVYALVPRLMFGMGLIGVNVDVNPDPRTAEPGPDDPDHARRYAQFEALGFRPTGSTIERCWFITPLQWYFRSCWPSRWMTSPDGSKVVDLFRVFPHEPVRFAVQTVLTHGGFVTTNCPGVGLEAKDGRRVRTEMLQVEPDEAVRRHDEIVATFCQERGLTIKPASIEDVVAVSRPFTIEDLKRGGQHGRGIVLGLFGVPAMFTALHLGNGFDPRNWRAIAGGLCVGALVLTALKVYVHFMARRAALRSHAKRPQL